MKYIHRAISDVLERRAASAKVVLLCGARQVGKSTVIQHVFNDYHLVSFDNRLERLQAREEPNLFFMNNKTPLVIDEVQKEPSVLEEIKLRLDASDERGTFILTGSQKLELMKGASESLAGRVSILELGGLSLREMYNIEFNEHFLPNDEYIFKREKCLKPYDNIWDVIFKGSYPEMYSVERDWDDFYKSYVNTYLERDINELVSADSVTFSKFMTVLAARTGQLLNYASIAREVEVSLPTVKTWVSILERTGVVFLLQPYYSSVVKRAIKTPKVYFFDTGLACYLSGWTEKKALERSAVAGNMFETFVVSEILKSFMNEGKDAKKKVFFYRGKDKTASRDNEIDLIVEEDNTLWPIEIKMTGNPQAKMGDCFSVLKKERDKEVGRGTILCQTDKKRFLAEDLLALPISYV